MATLIFSLRIDFHVIHGGEIRTAVIAIGPRMIRHILWLWWELFGFAWEGVHIVIGLESLYNLLAELKYISNALSLC